jgi:hypothetical protein
MAVGTVLPMPLEENKMIFGYLDPGSGSLLLQAVIGGATGLAVAVKAMRAKYGFGRGKAAPTPDEDDAAEDPAQPVES